MTDTTVTKIDSRHSPKGHEGQKYLACGTSMSMRLWENESVDKDQTDCKRDYETLGFVIKGKAELHIEGQMVLLNAGDSWVVPKGASHHYKILEEFSAVETTSPPAELHDRAGSDHALSAKEFFEVSAKDAAAVKEVEPVKKDSADMKAKANTETQEDAEAKPETDNRPDGKTKACDQTESDKPAKCEADAKSSENQAKAVQDIAAEIPRTESKPTSNAEEKTPQPAEHIDVSPAAKGEKENENDSSK